MKQKSLMGILILTSYIITGFTQVSLASKVFPEAIEGQEKNMLVSLRPTPFPLESTAIFPPPLGELFETQCDGAPTGVGIPGFQPGIAKSDVEKMLGVPTGTARGYWPNTNAVYYDLIPQQVSLGFLFDKNSQRIRQTEASFTSEVDAKTALLTLNSMLGCKLNEQIEQGLHKVWQEQTRRFSFNLNYLQGVIERQKGDRIYIGIWESDLH